MKTLTQAEHDKVKKAKAEWARALREQNKDVGQREE